MTEYRSQRLQQRLRSLDTNGGDNSSTNSPMSSSSSNRRGASTTQGMTTTTTTTGNNKKISSTTTDNNETFFNSDTDEEMEEEEEEENEQRSGTGRDRNALKRRREQVREASRRFRERKKYEVAELQGQIDDLTKELNRYKSLPTSSANSAPNHHQGEPASTGSTGTTTKPSNDAPSTPTGSFRNKEISTLRGQVTTLSKEIEALNGIIKDYKKRESSTSSHNSTKLAATTTITSLGDGEDGANNEAITPRANKYPKLSSTTNDPSIVVPPNTASSSNNNPNLAIDTLNYPPLPSFEDSYGDLYRQYYLLYQRIKEYEDKYMVQLLSKLSSSLSTIQSSLTTGRSIFSTSSTSTMVAPASPKPIIGSTETVISLQAMKQFVEDYEEQRITKELKLLNPIVPVEIFTAKTVKTGSTLPLPSSRTTVRQQRPHRIIQELSKGNTNMDRDNTPSNVILSRSNIVYQNDNDTSIVTPPENTNNELSCTNNSSLSTSSVPPPTLPSVLPPQTVYPPYMLSSVPPVPVQAVMDTTETVNTACNTLYHAMLDIGSFSNEEWNDSTSLDFLFPDSVIHTKPENILDYKIYNRQNELPILSYKIEILVQRIPPNYLSHAAWIHYTQSQKTGQGTAESYMDIIQAIPTTVPITADSSSNAAIAYRQDTQLLSTASNTVVASYAPLRDFVYGVQSWDHVSVTEMEEFLGQLGKTLLPPVSSFDNYLSDAYRTCKKGFSVTKPIFDDTLYVGVLRSLDHPYHPVVADIPRADIYGGWIIKTFRSPETMTTMSNAYDTYEPLCVLTLVGQIDYGMKDSNTDTIVRNALHEVVLAADTIVSTAQILKENESEGMVSSVPGFQPSLIPVYPSGPGIPAIWTPLDYSSSTSNEYLPGYYPVPVEMNGSVSLHGEPLPINGHEEQSSYVFPGVPYYSYYPSSVYGTVNDGTSSVFPPYVPVNYSHEELPVSNRSMDKMKRSYNPSSTGKTFTQRKPSHGSTPPGGKNSETTIVLSSTDTIPSNPRPDRSNSSSPSAYMLARQDVSGSGTVSRRSSISTLLDSDITYPNRKDTASDDVSNDDVRSGSVGLDALLSATDNDYREHRSYSNDPQRNVMKTE